MTFAVRHLRRVCCGAVLAGLLAVPASAASQHSTAKPDPAKPGHQAAEKPAHPSAKKSATDAAAELARIEALLTPGGSTGTPRRSAKTTKPAAAPTATEPVSEPAAKAEGHSTGSHPAPATGVANPRPTTKGTKPGTPESTQDVVRRIESLMAGAAKARTAPGAASVTTAISARKPAGEPSPRPKPLLAWESPALPGGPVLLWENDIAPIGRSSKRKGVTLMWQDLPPAPDPGK
jgi:hypothetical protein